MAALAVYSDCHPKRRAVRDGRCRECCQVGRAESPDDLLPAIIANCVQHAGPEVPLRCPHCHALWDRTGDYIKCWECAETFHRTSTRVLAPPRNTERQMKAARALRARRDR